MNYSHQAKILYITYRIFLGMSWEHCVIDNYEVLTMFQGAKLKSNEPIKIVHIQKLANQSKWK